MIEVVQNPADMQETYLDCLNRCFAGAWNARSYHWYLNRPFGTRWPDKAGVYENGRLVAGIGINYRQLSVPGAPVADIAILTAAWTLPSYQGRWHLARLIDASMRIARDKRCVALLSFVTAENASATILRRKGAVALPARYLFLSPNASLELPKALPPSRIIPTDQLAVRVQANSAVTFHYASEQEWRSQFLHRPSPTAAFDVPSGVAVVEHVGTTDRLQFLSKPGQDGLTSLLAMANRAQQRKRHFFHFTMSERFAASAADHGFSVGKGYAMVIDLESASASGPQVVDSLHAAPWEVQAGDRM